MITVLLIKMRFRSATTGKPRSVHLIIRHSGRETVLKLMNYTLKIQQLPAFRPVAEESMVKKAACIGNNKPVMAIGRGAAVSGANEEVYKLQKADIPVLTSPTVNHHEKDDLGPV